MTRSYATIKIEKSVLNNILPNHTVNFSLDCDNSKNSGLFAQYSKNTTINGGNYTVSPAQLNIQTGEVQGFTDDKNHETHNSYSMSKEELEDIINNYEGLVSFPIYPGEFKNLRISISTNTSTSNYMWKSKSATFKIVIGKPSEVDDIKNNIYSANRNFFFGNVTELTAE